jgi:hypothetical protein
VNPGTVTVETILAMENMIGMKHPKFKPVGTPERGFSMGQSISFEGSPSGYDGRGWMLFYTPPKD